MTVNDLYGTIHPSWREGNKRFNIKVIGYEPDEQAGWTHKLLLVDLKYQDSDGYPMDAIAAGDSWELAFTVAGAWATQALDADHCIF